MDYLSKAKELGVLNKDASSVQNVLNGMRNTEETATIYDEIQFEIDGMIIKEKNI